MRLTGGAQLGAGRKISQKLGLGLLPELGNVGQVRPGRILNVRFQARKFRRRTA